MKDREKVKEILKDKEKDKDKIKRNLNYKNRLN